MAGSPSRLQWFHPSQTRHCGISEVFTAVDSASKLRKNNFRLSLNTEILRDSGHASLTTIHSSCQFCLILNKILTEFSFFFFLPLAPYVNYIQKDPGSPCSLTEALEYVQVDILEDLMEKDNAKASPNQPPKNKPHNLTVVAMEGCHSFIILDWALPLKDDMVSGMESSPEASSSWSLCFSVPLPWVLSRSCELKLYSVNGFHPNLALPQILAIFPRSAKHIEN